MRERRRHEHAAGRSIEGVGKAVLIEVHERVDRFSGYIEIGEDHCPRGIVVPAIVRRELISPYQRPVLGLAREHAARPAVVSATRIRIVWAGVAGAVIDEIEFGVVGDPAPHGRAAPLPGAIGPAARAELGAADIRWVEGSRPHEHSVIRAEIVGRPDDAAAVKVERLQPAVDPELAARGADDDPVANDQRRHGRGFPIGDVRNPRLPHLAPRGRIDGDGVPVEQVVDDLAVGEDRAAIDRIAAGRSDRVGADVGTVFPLQRVALARQVERVEDVRPRRDHVHRAADDERLPLVAAEHAGGECPSRVQPARVVGGNLRERAEAGRRIVMRRHRPIAVRAAGRCRPRRVRGAAVAGREQAERDDSNDDDGAHART